MHSYLPNFLPFPLPFPLPLLLLLLISLPASTHALFGSHTSLPDLVHNWLHFAANIHTSDKAPPAHHPRASPNSLPISHIPPYIIGAADANTTSPLYLTYDAHMMHRPEVDLITSYLRKDDVYLEFGSGVSTRNFAGLVKRAYSIDHNCDWAQLVRNSLVGDRFKSVNVICKQVKRGDRGWGTHSIFEHANYVQFREYVDAVDELQDRVFDKVLIDGRARLACALRILPHLNNDSLVFIHDFYARLHLYGSVLKYYQEVARVLAYENKHIDMGPIDEPQGLVVLRKRGDVNSPVSQEEIDRLYETIDWREPFGEPLVSMAAHVRNAWWMGMDWGNWKRARNAQVLIELVRHDLLRMAFLYALVMMVLRNWDSVRTLLGRNIKEGGKDAGPEISSSASEGRRAGRAIAREDNEIRFVETEGMKVASARRKRASMGKIAV